MNPNRMILLVEDSAVIRELLCDGLRHRGFTPVAVASGAAAMGELARTRYDMVCSAQQLPDMLGTALCGTLRRDPRLGGAAFFLITADADADTQRRALPEGVTEVFHRSEIGELFNYISHYPFEERNIKGRVLLVEDDASLRALVAAMLQNRGLAVTPCVTADTAWPAFVEGDFDLVVTDVVLTGQMSGLQLSRRIRRCDGPRGATHILAITGYDDTARRIELFRAGIDDYIVKPLLEREFIARVANLLARGATRA